MGLDMYLNKANKKFENESELMKSVNDGTVDVVDVAYWRKHSDLHGYFADMYYARGGSEEFNCVTLILTKDDIETMMPLLYAQIFGDKQFTKTTGFFFGESDINDWIYTSNVFLEVLAKTDWDNETIYYSSWW